ncbi:hypothetical protein F4774DRAFT_415049 [Daldinia eschscholtzii]|nr:hypothetical protein F4774DRAFT_415049 [Daldinia eschscholtzii]
MSCYEVASDPNTITNNDMMALVKLWECFDTKPQMNWEKLSSKAGFKDADAAKSHYQALLVDAGQSYYQPSFVDAGQTNYQPLLVDASVPYTPLRKREMEYDSMESPAKRTRLRTTTISPSPYGKRKDSFYDLYAEDKGYEE